jgi:pSer/pThr/pTyr-binding forkhead associated (FHA) protein
MNLADDSIVVARLTWEEPQTGEARELVLSEGATASIGRLDTNDICIKEQHVSRQHAVIDYHDGVFMITDMGSANGVFINDLKLAANEAYPLTAGDIIRLHVPVLKFLALVTEDEKRKTAEKGAAVSEDDGMTGPRLLITNGPQEGSSVALLLNHVTIGRATSKADWEICIQDQSISRPHARLEKIDDNWVLYDLGSANGTTVNGTPLVNEKGRVLHDSDMITMGATMLQFRSS